MAAHYPLVVANACGLAQMGGGGEKQEAFREVAKTGRFALRVRPLGWLLVSVPSQQMAIWNLTMVEGLGASISGAVGVDSQARLINAYRVGVD